MKSREYLNTLNGLIYWLEDDAVMMRKRHCLPDDGDANDYLGEWLRGSEQYGHIARTVCFLGNTGREHRNWRELCFQIPQQ